jgi:hypothetical protein
VDGADRRADLARREDTLAFAIDGGEVRRSRAFAARREEAADRAGVGGRSELGVFVDRRRRRPSHELERAAEAAGHGETDPSGDASRAPRHEDDASLVDAELVGPRSARRPRGGDQRVPLTARITDLDVRIRCDELVENMLGKTIDLFGRIEIDDAHAKRSLLFRETLQKPGHAARGGERRRAALFVTEAPAQTGRGDDPLGLRCGCFLRSREKRAYAERVRRQRFEVDESFDRAHGGSRFEHAGARALPFEHVGEFRGDAAIVGRDRKALAGDRRAAPHGRRHR